MAMWPALRGRRLPPCFSPFREEVASMCLLIPWPWSGGCEGCEGSGRAPRSTPSRIRICGHSAPRPCSEG
eukprot:11488970-Alexandrium_andersonii.AAC.1